ncbi:hypothetical protein ACH47B_06425 [Rhodococcus sp. NPDC019627]|uniref:hypothetical protein n=1 Tax=unclassified Rhodococcus (in: high G+C Gram-positive bacteria) TaxID=192944 RepID=UPI0037ABE1DE
MPITTSVTTVAMLVTVFLFAGSKAAGRNTSDMYPPPGSVADEHGPRAHYRAQIEDATGITVDAASLDELARRVCDAVDAHAGGPDPVADAAAEMKRSIGAPPKGTMRDAFHIIVAEECPQPR